MYPTPKYAFIPARKSRVPFVRFITSGEHLEFHKRTEECADAHAGEEMTGVLRARLSGFVDLRGGDGFRERELAVFHKHAPENRDEHDPQNSRHSQNDGGEDVVLACKEWAPDRADEECRKCEDPCG
jgi:hypothetical protein